MKTESQGRTDGRRRAGLLLAAGAAQFLLALVAAESLYPHYSVSGNFISDLGVGPAAWLFNASVFALGAAALAAAGLLWREGTDPVFPFLLALSGLGAAGVGIFPETSGEMHFVASLAAFFFGGLAALLSFRLETGRAESLFSALLGLSSLAALALFSAGQYAGLGPGGMERLVAYPILAWGAWMGGRLAGRRE